MLSEAWSGFVQETWLDLVGWTWSRLDLVRSLVRQVLRFLRVSQAEGGAARRASLRGIVEALSDVLSPER